MNTQPQPTREEILETSLDAFLNDIGIRDGLFEKVSPEEFHLMIGLQGALNALRKKEDAPIFQLKFYMVVEEHQPLRDECAKLTEAEERLTSHKERYPGKNGRVLHRLEKQFDDDYNQFRDHLKSALCARLILYMGEFIEVVEKLVNNKKHSYPASSALTNMIQNIGRERLLKIVRPKNVIRFLSSAEEVKDFRNQRPLKFRPFKFNPRKPEQSQEECSLGRISRPQLKVIHGRKQEPQRKER